jgi:hypothetical protein
MLTPFGQVFVACYAVVGLVAFVFFFFYTYEELGNAFVFGLFWPLVLASMIGYVMKKDIVPHFREKFKRLKELKHHDVRNRRKSKDC